MQNQFKGQIMNKMTFRLKIGWFSIKLWEIKVFEKMSSFSYQLLQIISSSVTVIASKELNSLYYEKWLKSVNKKVNYISVATGLLAIHYDQTRVRWPGLQHWEYKDSLPLWSTPASTFIAIVQLCERFVLNGRTKLVCKPPKHV